MTRKLPAVSRLFVLSIFVVFFLNQTAAQSPQAQPKLHRPIDDTQLITLKGNVHPLARTEFDRGTVPANLPMKRMLLVLERDSNQETALEKLLAAQQDGSSPSYHQWLTPDKFGLQFGPAAQDVQLITEWLESHGFQAAGVSKGGTVIEFSGTAGQVQEAFHTTIHKYLINGDERYANASDPQLPAAFQGSIAGIRSLYNFPATAMNSPAGVFHRDTKTGRIVPAAKLPIQQFAPGNGFECGAFSEPCEALGPFDLGTIYNITPLWNSSTPIDGTGQTIAIVGETDIHPEDWTGFWNMFGVAVPKGTLNIIHNGPDPGIQGDESEADIDTQWSSAVAKGATIDYVVSQTTEATLGVDLSAEYIVDNNLAGVMSESYGVCELFIGTTGNAFYNALWQQAAAQGITVFVSSGDQGSAVCDRDAINAKNGLAVNGFSSTPYNVSVGGTDFNDPATTATYWNPSNDPHNANAKGYIPEVTWNDSCTNAQISAFFGTSSAEQTCNNPDLQEDDFAGVEAGSGGASNCTSATGTSPSSCSGGYPKPSWQSAPGVPNDGKRDVPDVSLFASNGFNGSFYLVCQTEGSGSCGLGDGQFLGFGGTSVASPAFAGIMALINQKTGERQGNANYVFYKMASTASNLCSSDSVPVTGTNNCIFYDTSSGSTIAMPCVSGSPDCTTSTSGDKFGVLSGFSTGPGFDQATGLGSVNVTNLVNQWSTYSGQFRASEFSSFTLGPPETITHGQSLPVTAAVAPATGTGTPTGSVLLIANTGASPSDQQALQQLFPLTNGAIAPGATATFLPGGANYTVKAHYSGDSTFAPSDSLPVTLTVNPEPSKLQVAVETTSLTTGQITSNNATSIPYGSAYSLIATATNSTGKTCTLNGIPQYGCPTGTLNLKDTFNGVTSPINVGVYSLNSEGYVEDDAISLTGGRHNLVASYGGDKSYTASSTGAPDVVTVTPEATNSSPADDFPAVLTIGTSVDVVIQTTTSDFGFFDVAPTGTYTLFDGAKKVPATVTTFTGGIAVFPNSPFFYSTIAGNVVITVPGPIGPHSFSATYVGDTNYGASTTRTFNVNVVYPSNTAIASSAPTIQGGQNVTFTATVQAGQAGGPPLTGSAQFQADGTNLGNPVNISNGQAQFTTSSLFPGQRIITANYSGDSNYAPSTAALTETVTPAPTFTVSAEPSFVSIGEPGGSGTATLTFVGANGYSGTIPLSPSLCSGMPLQTSCTFSVSSVALSARVTTTTAIVAFRTTRSGELAAPEHPTRGKKVLPFVSLRMVLFILILMSLLIALTRRWSRYRIFSFALWTMAALLVTASCGGGGGTGGGSSSGGGGTSGTPMGLDNNVVITFAGAGANPSPSVHISINVE